MRRAVILNSTNMVMEALEKSGFFEFSKHKGISSDEYGQYYAEMLTCYVDFVRTSSAFGDNEWEVFNALGISYITTTKWWAGTTTMQNDPDDRFVSEIFPSVEIFMLLKKLGIPFTPVPESGDRNRQLR